MRWVMKEAPSVGVVVVGGVGEVGVVIVDDGDGGGGGSGVGEIPGYSVVTNRKG